MLAEQRRQVWNGRWSGELFFKATHTSFTDYVQRQTFASTHTRAHRSLEEQMRNSERTTIDRDVDMYTARQKSDQTGLMGVDIPISFQLYTNNTQKSAHKENIKRVLLVSDVNVADLGLFDFGGYLRWQDVLPPFDDEMSHAHRLQSLSHSWPTRCPSSGRVGSPAVIYMGRYLDR